MTVKKTIASTYAGAGTCPGGHGLPHSTNKGQCTPLYCALETHTEGMADKRELGKEARKGKPISDGTKIANTTKDAIVRQQFAKARRRVRERLVEVPGNLEGDEAETHSDSRLTKLLPYAVAEIEYQLLYGDDQQRKDMAFKVLDATGRGKREASNGAGQTIILNISPNALPWAKETKVINAQVDAREADRGEKAALPDNGTKRDS